MQEMKNIFIEKPNQWKEINCEVCKEVRVAITLAICLKCLTPVKQTQRKNNNTKFCTHARAFLTKYENRYLSPWCIVYPLSGGFCGSCLHLWLLLPPQAKALSIYADYISWIPFNYAGPRKVDIIQTRDSELPSILDLSQFLMAYQLWQSEEFFRVGLFDS